MRENAVPVPLSFSSWYAKNWLPAPRMLPHVLLVERVVLVCKYLLDLADRDILNERLDVRDVVVIERFGRADANDAKESPLERLHLVFVGTRC